MAAISKEEYLKKYLSGDNNKEKKRKKKKKPSSATGTNRIKIVDDDVDFKTLLPENISNTLDEDVNADQPTVADFIDERPKELQILEKYRKDKKWKLLAEDDSYHSDDSVTEGSNKKRSLDGSNQSEVRKRRHDSDSDPPLSRLRKRHDSSDSDASIPRKKHNFEPTIQKSRTRHDSDSDPPVSRSRNRHDSDSDPSVSRSRKRHDSDSDPPVSRSRKRHDSDSDPPVSRSRKSHDSDSDPPVSRSRKRHDSDSDPPVSRSRKRQDSDSDPPVSRSRNRHDSGSNDEYSTHAKQSRKRQTDQSVQKIRNRHDSDSDPLIKRSKGRNDSDSDQSVEQYSSRSGKNQRDKSVKRKKSRFDSNSPYRKQNHPVMKANYDSDNSPIRKQGRIDSDSDQSPKRHRRESGSSNEDNRSKEVQGRTHKMTKTLGGAKAGLSTGREVRKETEKLKKREDAMFNKLGEERLGKYAKTVFRDKSGKIRDTEEEQRMDAEKAKKKAEKDEKYMKWGKGIEQVSQQEANVEDALYEMSKPLTRTKDDKDLDQMLKEQDREGDPMARFLTKKTKKSKGDKKVLPRYNGPQPPANRFNIWPGYRWDGVDRSNGFEKKLFASKVNKKAMEEIAYKWSTEDM